jgi:uracil-DNA glycosylase
MRDAQRLGGAVNFSIQPVMHGSKRRGKKTLLAELDAQMSSSCLCALKKTATQAVPGAGSAYASIIFIGEAPGKSEDLRGEPFVGAAGKFLDEMLHSIGQERKDIYITNVVKYRPPDNRDPFPKEIEDCAEWLHEQILIIDPLLIVTLGRHAMNHFFPKFMISEAHGKVFTREFPKGRSQAFYTLYHPAAALYNGGMRKTLQSDFLRIPEVLKGMYKGA